MACCLTAPSHYQCWLVISKVRRRSYQGSFTRDTLAISHCKQFEMDLSKISVKSPRDRRVNSPRPLEKTGSSLALFMTNVTSRLLTIGCFGTNSMNFGSIIRKISWKKWLHCKMSSAKWRRPCCWGLSVLAHWGLDKMVAISQMMFSNAFSWRKTFEFQIIFHWNMFIGSNWQNAIFGGEKAWCWTGDKPFSEPMMV